MTNVCDECGSDEIEYCDKDDSMHYCSDCYLELDKEFVGFQQIKKISDYIKKWSRSR